MSAPGEGGSPPRMLPECIEGLGHAKMWEEAVMQEWARLEMLARQAGHFLWMEWLGEQAAAAGFASVRIDWQWDRDWDEEVPRLAVGFPDGSRWEEDDGGFARGAWRCAPAGGRERAPKEAAELFGRMRTALDRWVEGWRLPGFAGAGREMGVESDDWLSAAFSPEELARWEAGRLAAAAPEPGKAGGSAPRM